MGRCYKSTARCNHGLQRAYVISWRFDYAKYRCDEPDADIICIIIIMDIMYVVRFIYYFSS